MSPPAGCGPRATGFDALWGLAGSGGSEVPVDEPAEAITTLDRAGGEGDHIGLWLGDTLVEPLMGPGLVVVVEELGQHAHQVSATEDQKVVEALAPGCATKSLGE